MQPPKYIQRVVALAIVALGIVALSSCTPEQVALVQRAYSMRTSIQNHPFLTCVRRHESDRGSAPYINGYRAKNPRSSASGAYQFLDGTWRKVSARAGYPGYSRALHAPPGVQDAVALWTFRNVGKSPWRGSGC